MAAKEDADNRIFIALGLDEKAARGAARKQKVAEALRDMIFSGYPELKDESSIDSFQGDAVIANLFLEAAGTLKESAERFRGLMGEYIASKKLATKPQVMEAVKYINNLARTAGSDIDKQDFERATGVGVTVSEDEMREGVKQIVEKNKETLLRDRYTFPYKSLLVKLRQDDRLKWGDMSTAKVVLDEEVLSLLGPKTEADEEMLKQNKGSAKGKEKGKKSKGDKKQDTKKAANKKETVASAESATNGATPPGGAGMFVGRDVASALNTKAQLDEHKHVTSGIVRTRFPPEPNGFLHIGHAKSMNLNFDGAFRALGMDKPGDTIFRYDDTNPEAESEEYIQSQADNVSWLGWKPCKVTHSSDYFDELYKLAVELIKRGKAYICHQTAEQVKASREIAKSGEGDPNSPWRDRPIEESLREFERMRMGMYKEGEVTLRMKIDMTSPNPCMWDPVAYRIKYHPHPRCGDKWCIYPSYDFTHCIVDSLEHIDYSLCTLEFEVRRDTYYWLLEALDLWRPYVWEFSRLNISYTVLSKRKILKLVKSGMVRGWDDPRILTINGLRRRGYTPDAINNFCREVGVTRKDNTVQIELLEHCCRADMDLNAPRRFGVLRPIKLVLNNVDDDFSEKFEIADFPKDPARGKHTKTLRKVVYIDRDDFRMEDDKSFYGLAHNKLVGLKYAGNITCTEVIQGANGEIQELHAEYCADRSNGKPKGNLHWISAPEGRDQPIKAEVRLYEHLFTVPDPDDAPGSWEDYINSKSETVLQNCYIDECLNDAPALSHFQFERVGFFTKDTDSTETRNVFNLTVSLRESTEAKAVKGKSSKNANANGTTSKRKKQAGNNSADPYSRICVRVGQIRKAYVHPEADKLFCEEIDVGEAEPRQICSGLVGHYTAEELEGKVICVVTNLKPRPMRGFTSHGMVLCAADSDKTKVELIEPPCDATIGERVIVEGYTNDEPDEEVNPGKKTNNPWTSMLETLKTDEHCVATYKGVALTTSKGPCKAASLSSSQIS